MIDEAIACTFRRRNTAKTPKLVTGHSQDVTRFYKLLTKRNEHTLVSIDLSFTI
jgi:hypothetical protein